MPSILFTNNAATTLASGITNVATSLTVAAGKGALFPTISGSDFFYATLANGSGGVEIVKVTARSTDTFTIVRGQDGTSGVAWNTGDKVELRVTAAAMGAMAQTANNLSDLASASTARTNLGLGTIATQAASSVSITGGSITGITDLTVADGGTGASTLTSGGYLKGAGTSAITSQTGIPAGDITSGTVGTARLGSGTASSSTYLRGDQTWATAVTSVAASGGITGGTITTTGTLSLDTNNTFGIGSTNVFILTRSINQTAGATLSGSYLFYVSAQGTTITTQSNPSSGGYGFASWLNWFAPMYDRTTAVTDNGVTYSPVGGTWRILASCPKATLVCGVYGNGYVLAIRTA